MQRKPEFIFLTFILLVLSAILTKMHFDIIDTNYVSDQIKLHTQIIEHTAPSPYQYRILQPTIVNFLLKLVPERYFNFTFLASYAFFRFASLLACFLFLFLSLRDCFSRWASLFGVVFLAAFIPFTYRGYYFQPTSIFEYCVFSMGLLATVKKKILWLYPIVLFGTLNRETTVFIPLVYFLWRFPMLRKSDYFNLAAIFSLWVLVFVGLRLLWPAPSGLLDVGRYVRLNMSSSDSWDVFLILIVCLLPVATWRSQPKEYRRLLFFNVAWIPLHFLASQWWEIRYFIPSILVSLPGILWALDSAASHPQINADSLPSGRAHIPPSWG